MQPAKNDLLLRPIAIPNGERNYALLNAVTKGQVAGPFLTLGDAVLAAREIAARDGIDVWHEQVDDKGRVMGPFLRMFSSGG